MASRTPRHAGGAQWAALTLLALACTVPKADPCDYDLECAANTECPADTLCVGGRCEPKDRTCQGFEGGGGGAGPADPGGSGGRGSAPGEEAGGCAEVADGAPSRPNPGDCGDDCSIEMVRVPAGEFLMGSPEDEQGRLDAELEHTVRITRPFMIGRTEVTQAEWEAVMGHNPSRFADCGGDCPVETVSWLDVIAFCNALSRAEGLEECYLLEAEDVTWPRGLGCAGYRLPTEAEWEYAMRAGTQTAWSCGADTDCLDGVAWYSPNSASTTHPVGTEAANAWGLHDMHGNVWEWVWDRYGADHYADGQVDPTGPAAGAFRGLRGGGWLSEASEVRAAHRYEVLPSNRLADLGFRPTRSVP